ncbi:hypothetical protein [Levilactobacillus bambusae]|uniref:hypothetical protein n=1 Tax=Levilactobacillus bambusae TaxID=2024736 RepID=UPI00140361C4|nr:hypothetical protein [Levilactobacillus bambusae]
MPVIATSSTGFSNAIVFQAIFTKALVPRFQQVRGLFERLRLGTHPIMFVVSN